MTAHREILDQPDSLRKQLTASLGGHSVLVALVILYSSIDASPRQLWGDPNSLGGGAVAITPVSKIPLPQRGGLVNPVANDTESRVPLPPKPEAAKKAPDPEEAIPIKSKAKEPRKAEQRQVAQRAQKYRAPGSDSPNQIYSSTGAAASSPMYGSTSSGSGGVGLSSGSPFGNRFGYYEQILRERVAQVWRTTEVDARLQTAPPVIVTFVIRRDGTVAKLQVLQRSGNPTLDYSCQRAILEAAPFPPLPAGFERDSAAIEFWFQLKR